MHGYLLLYIIKLFLLNVKLSLILTNKKRQAISYPDNKKGKQLNQTARPNLTTGVRSGMSTISTTSSDAIP